MLFKYNVLAYVEGIEKDKPAALCSLSVGHVSKQLCWLNLEIYPAEHEGNCAGGCGRAIWLPPLKSPSEILYKLIPLRCKICCNFSSTLIYFSHFPPLSAYLFCTTLSRISGKLLRSCGWFLWISMQDWWFSRWRCSRKLIKCSLLTVYALVESINKMNVTFLSPLWKFKWHW